MKNKILKTFLFFTLFSVLLITACFAVEIKEDPSKYESSAFIIGSTRFDSQQIITADKLFDAGINEKELYDLLGKDIKEADRTFYYYVSENVGWLKIGEETEALSSEETKKLEENLNIFFVNNEEKVMEVPYDGTVDEDSIWSPEDNVTFENGAFQVPVLTHFFTFLSNNVANNVETNVIESVLKGEDIVENVEIIPQWAAFEANGKYYDVDSIDEMLASADELNIKLVNYVDLKTAIVIDKKVTIDLNHQTLTAKEDTAGEGIFKVVTGGDLTINGDGYVDSACLTNDYSMAIWATGEGKVTINGGTYTNVDAKDFEDNGTTPNNNELIYANGSGKITINDGMFIGNTENETYGARYTLNLKDNSEATITVKGGTFTGYNPASSASENPRMNFLADGYKVVAYGDDYVVEPVEEIDAILGDGIACADLQTAVDSALKVKLLKNIDLETAVVVSKKVTVDLNGKTLTAKEDTAGDGIFKVVTGGDLTINGEGTIDSACLTNDYSMAIWATETGKVTINGGTFTNKGAKDFEDNGTTPNNNELIYANVNGQITINGGTFIGNIDNQTYGARYTLNLKDKDNQVASIIVKGGTFTGYDPANSKSENPTANLVADGYKSVKDGDTYKVVPYDANNVTDEEELRALIAEGKSVTLASDVEITKTIVVNKPLTLNLNGKTIENKTAIWNEASKSWSLISVRSGGILTIDGNGTLKAMADDCYAIDVQEGGNVTIENGKYVGNISAVYVYEGTATINGGDYSIQQLPNGFGDYRYTLNCWDENYVAGAAKIIVNDGTFMNFDPADNLAEGPNTSFVPENIN